MSRRPARQERSYGRRILIACEGTRTEPGYLEDIRISRRIPTVQVILAPHTGSDPLSVVTAAQSERARLRSDRRWTIGDEAWAVFDGDEHRHGDPERWRRSLQLAERERISLAVSNPCIELWYLLHIRDYSAPSSREQVCRVLAKELQGYEKSERLYDRLKDRTIAATERARRLCSHNLAVGDDPYRNPMTEVWRLVDRVLSLRTAGPR